MRRVGSNDYSNKCRYLYYSFEWNTTKIKKKIMIENMYVSADPTNNNTNYTLMLINIATMYVLWKKAVGVDRAVLIILAHFKIKPLQCCPDNYIAYGADPFMGSYKMHASTIVRQISSFTLHKDCRTSFTCAESNPLSKSQDDVQNCDAHLNCAVTLCFRFYWV